MRKVILLLVFSFAAEAQGLSVGVLGGAPVTDVVNGQTINGIQSIAESANFTIGPTLQVNLPASLRLEVDALLRPYSFNLTGLNVADDISSLQWRFPFLLQYRFGVPLVKPFVEAGLSFDHLSNISAAAKSITSGPGELLHSSNASIVLGAGLDVKVPFVRLSGELRYSRQTVSNFSDVSNQNQAEILVAVRF
jgi:hypothetical protein